MSATRAAGVLAALIAAAVLVGCVGGTDPAPDPSPRAVTSEEAQLLAVTRFRNYDAGSRPFTTSLSVSGVETELAGWIDWASALGYAAASGSFGTEGVLWNDATVGAIPIEADADGRPPLPIPSLDDPGWQFQELDAGASPLYALLAALSGLGLDRPDNPLLVQQSGALWLREDELGGVPVTVFAAPADDAPVADTTDPDPDSSPLRLWIDDSGTLMRAEVRLGAQWTTVDFEPGPGPRLELPGGEG